MNLNISIKSFILIGIILLTVIFFFVVPNLSADTRTTTIIIKVNSTYPATQLSVSGAQIINLEPLTPSSQINYSTQTIFFNNAGLSVSKIKLNSQNSLVTFTLSKNPLGTASAQIEGVGLLENTHKAIAIPIHITTDASFSRIRFVGMSVKNISNLNLSKHSYYTTYDDHQITINNTAKNNIDTTLDTKISFENTTGIITLEKSDDGIFSTDIEGYHYTNIRTGEKTLQNIPFIIEMTSNQSQIFFNNGSIIKAKILSSNTTPIIGNNFIYLNYPGDIDYFHRSEYLLDISFNQTPELIILKTNDDFVNAKLAGINYFSIGSNPNNTYYTQTYPITQLPPSEENKQELIKSPLIIETTSDWTTITFEGLDNPKINITGFEGSITRPDASANTISIKKKISDDTTSASVKATIQASGQNNPLLNIEKGDLGSTTVILGENQVFLNGKNIARDPLNHMTFTLSSLPQEIPEKFETYYNPASFIFPSSTILDDKGLTIADTQSSAESVTIPSSALPGLWINMKSTVAEGLIAFIFISYVLLGILLLCVIKQEGFFSFLQWETKLSFKKVLTYFMQILERMSISSTLILEALVMIVLTSFLQLINVAVAEYFAILAYLLIIAGVILRLLETKKFLSVEKSKEMFIKFDSVALILATGFIVAFELRPPSIMGLLGIAAMIVVTIIFLGAVFIYSNQNLSGSEN